MSKQLVDLYSCEECNALMTAIRLAARDWYSEEAMPQIGDAVYEYLETSPKTSLVAELVQKIHELGYTIKKN